MRREFILTGSDIRFLAQAIIGGPPSGVQARANAAWAVVGLRRGFDWTTIEPTEHGKHCFSAEEMMVCTAESFGGIRCPRPVVCTIGDEPFCQHHKNWIEEDAANALTEARFEAVAAAIQGLQASERN